jgi:hypothetical protein
VLGSALPSLVAALGHADKRHSERPKRQQWMKATPRSAGKAIRNECAGSLKAKAPAAKRCLLKKPSQS